MIVRPRRSPLRLPLPRRWRAAVIGFLAFALWADTASAFEPQFPGYVHRAWTVESGLPQNIVRTLIASRDGYLWLGTSNGLHRYDGVTFASFTMGNTPALPSNWIASLYESADGTLWIGTSNGLVRYRAGVFTREEAGLFSGKLFVSLSEDGDGRLMASSAQGVYQREERGRWKPASLESSVRTADSVALARDSRGALWLGSDRRLIEWRGTTRRIFTTRDGLPDAVITTLVEDPSAHRLWIGTARGLAHLDLDTGTIHTETGPLAALRVRRLFVDRDGTLWIGALRQLVSRSAEGAVTVYPVTDTAEEVVVTTLGQDAAGQIWFGLHGGAGGLHRLTRRRVTSYTRAQGLPCDNISSVAEGPDGTLWFATFCAEGSSVVALTDDRMRAYVDKPLDAAGAIRHVTTLLPLPDGDVLIGGAGSGLVRLAGGRFTPVPGPFPAGLTYFTALYRDKIGALWVGTTDGLARYHDGQWRRWRTADDGLPGPDVRTIIGGVDDAVWIGTGAGVARYHNGRLTSYGHARGVPPGEVRALHADADGGLWIGTYGSGLALMKDGRTTRFDTYAGLLDTSVHRIIDDQHGSLWLSGDRGIRRVNRQDLVAIAAGRGGSPRVDVFDTADGMVNAECNGMGQPAGVRTRHGVLWFPTQGGLVRLEPSVGRREAPAAPRVTIEGVRVNGVDERYRQQITVPPGARDLEILYTAPALVRPEQVSFRYRLLGYDDRWIEAGTRRIAHFAGLAPGAYQFQVTARDSAGDWNATPVSLGVLLQPHVYQRLAFKLTVAGLLLLGVAGGVRWRLRHLRRRAHVLEATVAVRTRELQAEREGLKVAHAEVEASHARLLATFNQLRVGVLLVDSDVRVRFLSEAMRPLVSGPLDDLLGHSLDRVLPVSQESLAAIRGQIRAPQRGVRITAELTPESGQHYWTEIEVHPDISDPNQCVLHLYDVTETFGLKRALQTGPRAVGAELLGDSVVMCNLRGEIAVVGPLDATVLIDGETGTGKELVARAIHAASRRKARPFVAINCAGLTESLLASQLFGHRRGAFTGAVNDQVGLFEAAQGGTLLLDEIGDMPLSMQTHLLRVLEERQILRVGDSRPRPIDVRLLAATNRDLDADVKSGRFREDLFYRIRVVRLRLPPLRLRINDVPVLALAFLRRARTVHALQVESISREAMAHLQAHPWPGNVRQLKATIEGAAIRSTGPVLKLGDVLTELPAGDVPPARASLLSERERRQIIDALRQTNGNRSAAARLLGWARSTFYHRLARLEAEGVELPSDQPRSTTDSQIDPSRPPS